VFGMLSILYFYLPHWFGQTYASYANFGQSIITNLLAACILFILSYIFLRKFYDSKGEDLKQQFSAAVAELLIRRNQAQEVEGISYSNIDTDWNVLLEGATAADICVFYLNHEWEQKNFEILKRFARSGGKLSVYLPNPISLSGRFFGSSRIDEKTSERIMETYVDLYRELVPVSKNVQIKFADKGFSFMFSRIQRADGSRFLFSPYPNVRPNSPTIVINEAKAPDYFRQYAAQEVTLLNAPSQQFNFEEGQYIVWSNDGSKVFVSSELSCSAGCEFCFVGSLNPDIRRASLQKTPAFSV